MARTTSNKTELKKEKINKSKKIIPIQKGGGESELSDDSDIELFTGYDDASINSSDEMIGRLDSDEDIHHIDLNKL